MIAGVVPLSALSYHFVENPVRRAKLILERSDLILCGGHPLVRVVLHSLCMPYQTP